MKPYKYIDEKKLLFIGIPQLFNKDGIGRMSLYLHFAISNKIMDITGDHQWLLIMQKREVRYMLPEIRTP